MKDRLPYCLNCQEALPNLDNFCPNCGQKNHATKLTIKSFLEELTQSIFSFDTRIWLTLKMAFLKVGQLALEFNQGKRRKYVRPIQFYLFCSLIYFLLASLAIRSSQLDGKTVNEYLSKQDTLHASVLNTDITLSSTELRKIPSFSFQQLDSLLVAKNIKSDFFIYNFFLGQSLKIMEAGPRNILQQLFSIISVSMFLLVPIFAWLLYLYFSRHYSFYVEHLVFSIYLHGIIFLILSTKLLTNVIGFMGWSNYVFYIAIFLYGLIGMKQFYKHSWFKTIFYALIILLVYVTIFILFMVLSLVISLNLA